MDEGRRRRVGLALGAVWIAGFLVGTTSHVADIVAGGFGTYVGYPSPLRIFWVSLTLLDPIVVLLLALRRRAGIVLALIVIVVDIAVNWTVFATGGGNPLYGVVNQTLFAAVLFTTAPTLWRTFPRRGAASGRRDRG